MDKSSVVSVKNVMQQFGDQLVLNNINLDVKKGEIIGLLGPSGSGKTTLVRIITGMNEPMKGEVSVLSTRMPSLQIIPKIGYMAQSDALYGDLTGYDNMEFFGKLYKMNKGLLTKRISELMTLVQLQNHSKKAVRNYSGGMKRRLSLAISLLHDPDILILDEPTVGIDPLLRREFWNEFKRLKQAGKTIIVTTHVMDEADHCDRLALIRDGVIIASGTPSELKESSGKQTVEEAFLFYGEGDIK